MFYEWREENLIINIRIQPKAASNGFAEVLGDPPEQKIKLRITAPPIDGKANKHLITYIAKLFKVTKSAVHIISGENSRNKRLQIDQPQRLPECIDTSHHRPATLIENNN